MSNLTVDPLPRDNLSSLGSIGLDPQRGSNPLKALFIGILIFVLLSVTAYGAYWYGQSVVTTKPAPSTSSPTEKVSPSSNDQTQKPTPVDETVNWKTYTNSKYGFSFKYSSDYFKFQQEFPNIGIYLAPSQGEGGNGPKFLKSNDVWIDATTLSGANLKSLDEYFNLSGQQMYPAHSKRTPTVVDGISGYLIEHSSPVSAGNITEYTKEFIFLRKEIIYKISLSSWEQNTLRANQNMFDQILSTFKFL